MKYIRLLALFLCSGALFACSKAEPQKKKNVRDGAVPVTLAEVREVPWERKIVLVGTLLANQDAHIAAEVEGSIEKTLAEAGAKLSDMVTMTVFLSDARYTTRMTELRTELFGQDFPASAAITVQGFAQPEMMIEVQGIAVTT